jgi:hypothetical protein
MPYTTTEQVRSYLSTNAVLLRRVVNQPLVLDSNEDIPFFDGALAAGSVQLKAIRANRHSRVSAVVTPGVSFSAVPVVPGSVVVANNSSFGQVYVEPVDFVIDHNSGTLSPSSGGALQSGVTIVIWYLPYTLFVESSDYHVDPEKGTIRRSLSGDIALGETVYLDYTPVHTNTVDELIVASIAAANGLVERTVDPTGQFEADPILGLAATYSALEIICRASAVRDLSSLSGQEQTARVWIQLAADYASRAENLLSSFRPPAIPLASPTLT